MLQKIANPPKPEKKGYNPKLLLVDGEEFSFEEARAAARHGYYDPNSNGNKVGWVFYF